MKVYLWQAGNAEGVTGDDERARTLAVSFMGANVASEAVVETAYFDIGINSLAVGYAKTGGLRWTAYRQGERVVWKCRRVAGPAVRALPAA